MLFEPDTNFQFAGLVIWQDRENFLQFGRAFCDPDIPGCVGNGIYFDKILGGGFSDGNFATQFDNPFNPSESYLRLERRSDMVRAFYSHEGITWTEIGTHWIPEDFQVNAVGLTASQDTSGSNNPADFDFFELSEGWGFLPEGFHDYDSGDLPAWACNEGVGVGGWAADPDDRETDLAIEVNVDGTSLAEWLYAGLYREDLDQAGVCVDGNCSFSTSLPGPFSLDEPHSVVVYAQDIPSGDWVQLSNSPKTFTCQAPPPPRIYAGLTDDTIRYEYTAPYAPVTFSLYDAPQGNLLWEDSRTADEAGFSWVSIWDYRRELDPGTFIVVTDGIHTNELVVEEVSIDLVDEEENILAGKAPEGRFVWVVANNDPDHCGVSLEAGPGNVWQFDFDDLACDITADMVFYAQVMDDEEDTSEANPDFIDGWHDGNEGVGHANTCNAGGFVLDTDDRSRDLEIRILSDGEQVATTMADQAWTDLEGVCGEDGSCGFYVNLWDLISTYEEHQITVQARDSETSPWHDLGGTPRTLTCVNYDIYAFNPETGVVERITALEDMGEYDPSWSPNGRRIVHDAADAESHALYITDVRTHISTPLPGGENGNDAAWSWTGRWIAFDRRWSGEPNIYIVPAEGGIPSLVRSDAVRVDWAPNSKRIVFQQPSDGSIWTAAADGGKGADTFIAKRGSDPAWSPDGNWIAYELDGNLWKVQVNILGKVLGAPIQVTHLSGWSVGAPTWSLDSQAISFNGGVDNDMDVWKVPAAGGAPVWVTGAPGYGDYGPENARNSSKIAYASPSPDGQAARYWMSFWSHDPPADTFAEGQYGYQYHVRYTVPEEQEWYGIPLTLNVTDQAPLYDGYALLGPWMGMPQQAWTGSACDAVDALNLDQPVRFVWGWVNDYPMSYEEAWAHFNSFTIDVSWDGAAAGSGQLMMGDLVPFTGRDTRFNYLCNVLAEHP
jgi:Tol biopolymer transport system component